MLLEPCAAAESADGVEAASAPPPPPGAAPSCGYEVGAAPGWPLPPPAGMVESSLARCSEQGPLAVVIPGRDRRAFPPPPSCTPALANGLVRVSAEGAGQGAPLEGFLALTAQALTWFLLPSAEDAVPRGPPRVRASPSLGLLSEPSCAPQPFPPFGELAPPLSKPPAEAFPFSPSR